MLKVIYLSTFAIIIGTVLFPGCSKKNSNKNPNLEFEIFTDKKEYYEGEPVWLTVKVKNISKVTENVEFWNDVIDRNLEVDNPGGQITNDRKGLFVERLDQVKNIKPDSVLTLALELQPHFGDGSESIPGYNNKYFTEGEHTVHFWSKSLYYADPIEFTVIKPPEEERKVLEELLATDAQANYRTSEEMLELQYNFAVNHKGSRYFEMAVYSMLVNQSSYKMNNEQLEFCLWYIDHYYNSNYMGATLGVVLQTVYNLKGGKQGALNFLNHIIQKYPNTIASHYAADMLVNPVIKELYLK